MTKFVFMNLTRKTIIAQIWFSILHADIHKLPTHCNKLLFTLFVRYKKQLGLLVTTYQGYIEIFDNIDFKSVWNNSKYAIDNGAARSSKKKYFGTSSITHIEYSEALDL